MYPIQTIIGRTEGYRNPYSPDDTGKLKEMEIPKGLLDRNFVKTVKNAKVNASDYTSSLVLIFPVSPEFQTGDEPVFLELIIPLQSEPDAFDQIAEAACNIAFIYEEDQRNSQSTEEREQLWFNLADAYPDFADKILELKKELSGIPAELKGFFAGFFDAVENSDSRKLLSDILWIRIKSSINDKNMQKSEIDLMLKELGFQREKIKEPLYISLESIMGKILTGELLI